MDTDNDNMDEKEYTCYYCQSPLSYDVCLSGSHFCLQGSNAIEFWGNVVKKTTKVIGEDQENDEDDPAHDDDVAEDDSVDKTIKGIANDDLENIVCSDSKDDGCKSEDDKEEADSDTRLAPWKLQFINLIKERPALYNKKLPLNQRSFTIRAKCWREIHEALNYKFPIEMLPKKFKMLKDQFNRESRRIKEDTSAETWPLFKHLKFLSNSQNTSSKQSEMSRSDQDIPMQNENDLAESDEENFGGVEEQLAELVGERPALYDNRLPRNERSPHVRVRLWQEVFDALNGAIPLVELPKRFKQLKERYLKEKKKPYTSDWPLMKYLSYLSDYQKVPSLKTNEEKRKSLSEMGLNPGIELRIASPLRNGFSAEDNNYFAQQFDEDSSSNNQRFKRKFEESLDNDEDLSLKRVEYDNWDEDDFFGAYLVRLMKKIPIENKLSLHMDIMKMVHSTLAKSKVRDT